MKIEFRVVTLTLPPTKDVPPPPISAITDQFSNNVLNAEAALRGWELRFSNERHMIKRGFVKITNVEVTEERKVKITAEIGLNNNAHNWDTTYEGTAEVLVIAEVADN